MKKNLFRYFFLGSAVIITGFLLFAPNSSAALVPTPSDFDINRVLWLHAVSDNVENWRETSRVKGVSQKPDEICVRHTKSGQWPVLEAGTDNAFEGNPWVVAKIGGRWYAGTYEWLRPGQECKRLDSEPPEITITDKLGPSVKKVPFTTWKPKIGEVVGFMMSTPARDARRTTNERSNIAFVSWEVPAGTNPEPTPIGSCDLITALWTDPLGNTITKASVGDTIMAFVRGTGDCAGKKVDFEVWEFDGYSNPDEKLDEFSRNFDSTGETMSAPWVVDATKDNDEQSLTDDNNYEIYFRATISGSGIIRSELIDSPQIIVPQEDGNGGGEPNGNGGGEPGETVTVTFEIPNPIEAESFTDLINAIARFIFNISIPIAVILIIYAGIKFLLSRGIPAEVQKAKDILKYTLVGLAIVLIGRGFVSLIKSVLDLGK